MSVATSAAKIRPVSTIQARPVIAMPSLSVVPSPAPRKGFAATVILCVALVFGALLLAFYLNTRMVQGAYEIKNIKVALTQVQMHEETLEAQAMGATSPDSLRASAMRLGMVPAAQLRQVDLEAGALVASGE